MKKQIAAIDIGTTKVCTIMGVLEGPLGLRVQGVGVSPSQGLEKALISDANKARESIYLSIAKAEMMAGEKMSSAIIGVSGNYLSSINRIAAGPFISDNSRIPPATLQKAIDIVLDFKTPAEKRNLHLKSGLEGSENELNLETAVAGVQNLAKCVQEVGINIEELVLNPSASAEAVLSDEERQAGVMVVDIGGKSADFAVFKNDNLYSTGFLPVGGNMITLDMATAFRLQIDVAEDLKKKYNSFTPEKSEPVRFLAGSGRSIPYSTLTEVIGARLEELISLLILDFNGTGMEALIPAGIVITGGCANMSGIAEMAHYITRLPVRVGVPSAVNGVANSLLTDPAYAASIGLILYRIKEQSLSAPKGLRGVFSPLVELFK